MRSIFFTIYGMAIGAAYAMLISVTARNEAVASAVCLGVLVPLVGFWGYGIARSLEMSNGQRLVCTPLAPAAMSVGLIGVGFVFLMFAVMWPFAMIRFLIIERRWRCKLKGKGRLATLDDLRPRLDAGDGTLIEETGNKGPYHIWWTADDLFSLGTPASTEEEIIAILTGTSDHPFNARCLSEYLDDESGKALLTPIPPRYARSGKLPVLFPRMRIATLVRPMRQARPA